MISNIFLENLKRLIPAENIKLQEPMNQHTTFRTGGVADCFLTVQNGEQLRKLIPYFRETEHDFFVLGHGSNLLVSDEGYRGIMLRLAGELAQIRVCGERIHAGAGASMARAARAACEHGLTGLEFASGIPGSIGGGVVMNAGAYDGEMSQVVETVTVMDMEGNLLELDHDSMEFGYRDSAIKNRPYIVLEACFHCKPGDPEKIAAYMEELAARRREKQPLEYPSAGSTFKRPAGYFAGKLIMDAGLRGYSVGDAQVSEKHCGFIINRGNAASSDINRLIETVQQQVKEKFDVKLEPEVIRVGRF